MGGWKALRTGFAAEVKGMQSAVTRFETGLATMRKVRALR